MNDLPTLSALAATLLAISLATERAVAILKTLLPEMFEAEKKTDAKEVDLPADRWRRLAVQAIAYLAAWATSAFLVRGMSWWDGLTQGSVLDTGLPSALVALLASGGSAFWAQVVGYTSALKDATVARRATESLRFTEQALAMGRTPIDSGRVARWPRGVPKQN